MGVSQANKEIVDLRRNMQELSNDIKGAKSNIQLLNSVYSSVNKFLSFLYDDTRSIKAQVQNYMKEILETQQRQTELLNQIIKKINLEETGNDSNHN